MPNAGFFEDVVLEDPAFLSSCQGFEPVEGASDVANDQQDSIKKEEVGESVNSGDTVSETNATLATQIDLKNDNVEEVIADVDALKLMDNVVDDESNSEGHHTLSTEDVDVHLDRCLLQALHMTVKDKDLPMPGSTLW